MSRRERAGDRLPSLLEVVKVIHLFEKAVRNQCVANLSLPVGLRPICDSTYSKNAFVNKPLFERSFFLLEACVIVLHKLRLPVR